MLIAYPDNEGTAQLVHEILDREGAEAVDAAHARWWKELRSAEREHYSSGEEDFTRDEEFYRLGFEAALGARNRCKEYDQVLAEMEADLETSDGTTLALTSKSLVAEGSRGVATNQRLCDQSRQPADQ